MAEVIRLGILSTASIAETILEALKPLSTIRALVVASRSLSKAQDFAVKHNIPTAVTYDQLLEQQIDAVYVPIPTAFAPEWAIRCAQAGLHVLVDKPFPDVASVESIVAACRENGVFFMDATHFVHASRTAKVREMVRRGDIGTIKRISSSFCVSLQMHGNIRADVELEPMGAAGDLGWYTMRSAVAYLGIDKAKEFVSVSAVGKHSDQYPQVMEQVDGVAVIGKGDQRVSLTFHADLRSGWEQIARIAGTSGTITVDGFVVPDSATDVFKGLRPEEEYSTDTEIVTIKSVSGFDEHGDPVRMYPVREVHVVEEVDRLSQPSMMMREFARMILETDNEAANKWAEETIVTQRLVDKMWENVTQASS
eukprot:GFKZ01007634.1.p1 GENE.GFKZ01007634.1~~GFKZ01007634.1.p1  ORF type:complete len:366 (+),score=45.38 GFKZ01007634.1:342-1439(+)